MSISERVRFEWLVRVGVRTGLVWRRARAALCGVALGLGVGASAFATGVDNGWEEAQALLRAGRLPEAAERCLQALDGVNGVSDPAQIVPATRLLLMAGRPFEAEKFACAAGERFAEAPEGKLARAWTALHLGRIWEARAALEQLAQTDHESVWMDYLMLRFKLLANVAKPAPRSLVDRLLAAGDRYPEFLFEAARWANRTGDRALETEILARFAVEATEAGFAVEVAQVRSWLAYREQFPGESTVEREPVVSLPMRASPLPMAQFSINGGPPVWLVVDTGATHLLLDAGYAREVAQLPAAPAMAHAKTSTGRADLDTVHVEEVTAPGLRLGHNRAAIVDWAGLFDDFAKQATAEDERAAAEQMRETRGLMPAGLLAQDSAVWFDVAGERLVIADAELEAAPRPARPGYERPFAGDLPLASFEFAGGVEGLLLLDTGKDSGFSFTKAWLRGSGVEVTREEESALTLGMAGIKTEGWGRVPDFSLWETFNFTGVVAGMSEHLLADSFTATTDAGLVGWAVLREFSPRFDYLRHKVTFWEPGAVKPATP
jgi:hypothetical protein